MGVLFMGSRFGLLMVVLVIASALIVILLVLSRFEFMSHAVASTVNVISFTVVNMSVNVPIYVVGSSLASKLAALGINESLIKLVSINQLPLLPNGSVVVVNWSIIKPSLIIGDPVGKVSINLTNPIIHDLANAIARNDIIGIYANGSSEDIIDFILAYSWAVASNNRLLLGPSQPSSDYLVAYPTIPVNAHEAVVFVAKWIKPRGLVIGPVYLSQLPTVIVNIMRLIIVSNSVDPLQGEDPCYAEYSLQSSETTLVWTAPMLYHGWYQYGIPGYSDGNGTYYWDTCLLASNYVFGNVMPSFPINVIGYENYLESSTMHKNGGFEIYQVGAIDYYMGYRMYNESITNALIGDGIGLFGFSSWNPPPMSSTTSYYIFLGLGYGIAMAPPLGITESISAS